MKKFLMTVILTLMCALSYGQMYIGGSLGSYKIGGTRSLEIAPEFGYCISYHSSVSVGVGYSTFRDSDTDETTHSLYVAPGYTYAIDINEYWCLNINASVGYSRFFRAKGNLLGWYIGPQLEYYLTDTWSLWGAFDAIAVECEWYDGQKITTNLNFNWFSGGINFGFYHYF